MLWFFIGCAHFGIPMPGKIHPFAKGSAPITTNHNGVEPSSFTPSTPIVGIKVSEIALGLKGQTSLAVNGQSMRFDCSGFVQTVFGLADISLSGNTRSLFEKATLEKRLVTFPSPGDVVFFDNTYDRNKNKRLDDTLTHIAIVVSVDTDGTVKMVHLGGSGITDLVMNVAHPKEHRSPEGKIWNSYLRINRKGETSPRLAGQLFRTYARFTDSIDAS